MEEKHLMRFQSFLRRCVHAAFFSRIFGLYWPNILVDYQAQDGHLSKWFIRRYEDNGSHVTVGTPRESGMFGGASCLGLNSPPPLTLLLIFRTRSQFRPVSFPSRAFLERPGTQASHKHIGKAKEAIFRSSRRVFLPPN